MIYYCPNKLPTPYQIGGQIGKARKALIKIQKAKEKAELDVARKENEERVRIQASSVITSLYTQYGSGDKGAKATEEVCQAAITAAKEALPANTHERQGTTTPTNAFSRWPGHRAGDAQAIVAGVRCVMRGQEARPADKVFSIHGSLLQKLALGMQHADNAVQTTLLAEQQKASELVARYQTIKKKVYYLYICMCIHIHMYIYIHVCVARR